MSKAPENAKNVNVANDDQLYAKIFPVPERLVEGKLAVTYTAIAWVDGFLLFYRYRGFLPAPNGGSEPAFKEPQVGGSESAFKEPQVCGSEPAFKEPQVCGSEPAFKEPQVCGSEHAFKEPQVTNNPGKNNLTKADAKTLEVCQRMAKLIAKHLNEHIRSMDENPLEIRVFGSQLNPATSEDLKQASTPEHFMMPADDTGCPLFKTADNMIPEAWFDSPLRRSAMRAPPRFRKV